MDTPLSSRVCETCSNPMDTSTPPNPRNDSQAVLNTPIQEGPAPASGLCYAPKRGRPTRDWTKGRGRLRPRKLEFDECLDEDEVEMQIVQKDKNEEQGSDQNSKHWIRALFYFSKHKFTLLLPSVNINVNLCSEESDLSNPVFARKRPYIFWSVQIVLKLKLDQKKLSKCVWKMNPKKLKKKEKLIPQ